MSAGASLKGSCVCWVCVFVGGFLDQISSCGCGGMAVSLKRRRVSGQGAVALMGAAVPVASLAEAHRCELGTIIESLEVAVVHVGQLRQAKQAGTVCDVLVADGSMYMAVTLLGGNLVLRS